MTYDDGDDWLVTNEDDADDWDDAERRGNELPDLLAEVMCEEYAGADSVELDDALDGMLESLSPAEAFSVTKALGQIGRGAAAVTSDPAFARIAGSVLPVAGGALGTVAGGPAGTALGARLGAAAASSLPKPKATHRHAAAGVPVGSASAGSAAAAQGLVLTQHPDVLKGLLALAVGEHGRRTVDGVPVAALMSMLSSVFGAAAADADELAYAHGDAEDVTHGAWDGDDASLYAALVDADNAELAEAVGWS